MGDREHQRRVILSGGEATAYTEVGRGATTTEAVFDVHPDHSRVRVRVELQDDSYGRRFVWTIKAWSPSAEEPDE